MTTIPGWGGVEKKKREAYLAEEEKVLVAFLVVQGSLACGW